MASLSEDINAIVATVEKLFRDDNNTVQAQILECSKIELAVSEYDNWNGGRYTYVLTLTIPTELYSKYSKDITKTEKNIHQKIAPLTKIYENEDINNVILTPQLVVKHNYPGLKSTPILPSFWEPDFFRLFISHSSKHSTQVDTIRHELLRFGISAFVAHANIEPTSEWLKEIEKALFTMDALAAYLTPDFIGSSWCNQEIGIAYGTQKLIIPIRAGSDPYGFIGKFQALKCPIVPTAVTSAVVANDIFDIICSKDDFKPQITRALVVRISRSRSYNESMETINRITALKAYLTDDLVTMLNNSITNSQVAKAYGVKAQIETIAQNHPVPF